LTFTVLRLTVPERSADEIVGVLGGDSCGAQCEGRRDGAIDVHLYFASAVAAETALGQARRLLAGLGLAGRAPAPALACVAEEPWVERFQTALEPFDLGGRFRVDPRRGGREGPAERIPIRLTPGRAFGTGEHPTTALCVELLEQSVRPRSTWLDLGCGTAILALVASHLGALDVLALDTDPEAVEVARRVLARNGLAAPRVQVACGSLAEAEGRRFDGIVANLSLPFFLAQASPLGRLLDPGGCLIASGFLEQDTASVAGALEGAGLSTAPPRLRGEWAALLAERSGAR